MAAVVEPRDLGGSAAAVEMIAYHYRCSEPLHRVLEAIAKDLKEQALDGTLHAASTSLDLDDEDFLTLTVIIEAF